MKNTDSIKRALETQRKAEEVKGARLNAIDKKLVSPIRVGEEIEAKSIQEQAYLKVKLK
jgi:hypothetical protein